MSDAPELPDGYVQTGFIHVRLGMGQEGTRMVFKVDGMELETAVGHLRSVLRRLEYVIDSQWDNHEHEGFEIGSFHFTCPECSEEVEVPVEDVDSYSPNGARANCSRTRSRRAARSRR
jgi:hypothetical protein